MYQILLKRVAISQTQENCLYSFFFFLFYFCLEAQFVRDWTPNKRVGKKKLYKSQDLKQYIFRIQFLYFAGSKFLFIITLERLAYK